LRASLPDPRWLQRFQAAGGGINRTIYDVGNGDRLPGRRVRKEGSDPTGDAAADEAYDGLGDTFKLYFEQYDRNSLDNAGMRLRASVHYRQNYDNAFWTGPPSNMMIFGDGDGELFNRFTIAVDCIGHELTHGVTQFESGLLYEDQPGALNEHLSDVFGVLVKQYKLNQTAEEAEWLIGLGLLTDAVQSGRPGVPAALRSMKAPGTAYDDPELGSDPQVAHMDDYVVTSADSGGVHINSGIPNHAFYVLATLLGGSAWEKAGNIWYATMVSRYTTMTDSESFQSFAEKTVLTSGELYGVDSTEERAVRASWQEVGITVSASSRLLRWRAGYRLPRPIRRVRR
jgi:Zn-dependent metalloprotease